MILTLDEVKTYLCIDGSDQDTMLQTLINAAEMSLYNATGIEFDDTNDLAKLYCMVLVSDWFENRELIGKVGERVRFTIQSIISQLKYCCPPGVGP